MFVFPVARCASEEAPPASNICQSESEASRVLPSSFIDSQLQSVLVSDKQTTAGQYQSHGGQLSSRNLAVFFINQILATV